ncbi:hypothetical protein [Neobacillus soli]|uniref:hypothetical protein n=1 Tax=Neobacillus soli TaxID=220688 RepID=UPI00082573AD|nr:hypothetical protein [Neobacillus soli]
MKERLNHRQAYINSRAKSYCPYSNTTKLVIGSVLAAFAAIFQSAGIFVGFGYALSILATLTIVLSTMLSFRIGFMSYFLTILLLAILQPSELLVFSLTTGLLGVALGMAFKWWRNWIIITVFGGAALSIGIMILLYLLRFPILGPSVSHSFDIKIALLIFLFSLLYSLIWMGLSQRISRLLFRATAIKTQY